jgi:hypothetical protein
MNDLSKKKVGDSVYDALGGEWKVVQIDNDDVFSLKVKSGDIEPKEAWITPDGEGEALVPAFFSEPVRVIPAQGECDFSGYQVGDEVYTKSGTLSRVNDVNLFAHVFQAGAYPHTPLNGKNNDKQIFFHAPPILAPSNPEAFRIPAHIAERKKSVDWSQVPIDTLVVADTVSGTRLRYFAGLRDGRLTYWRFGATSLTVEDSDEWGVAYNMRLANEENTK